jgi:hypothetical protein
MIWPVAETDGTAVVTEPPPPAGGLICDTKIGDAVVDWPPASHITWPVAEIEGEAVVTDPPPPAPATMATFTVEAMEPMLTD